MLPPPATNANTENQAEGQNSTLVEEAKALEVTNADKSKDRVNIVDSSSA